MSYGKRDEQMLREMAKHIDVLNKELSQLTFDQFVELEMVKRGTVMTFVVIGELANKLSKDFVNVYSEFPIRKIIGLRNVAAHEYGKINFELIWDTYKKSLPTLKKQIIELLGK